MIDLEQIAREIISNRHRRTWPSATKLDKTTLGLVEEVGEFESARKANDHELMVDALIDVIVFCLGGLKILEADIEKSLQAVIDKNKTRTHRGVH